MAALNFKITNSGLALLSQVSTIGPVTLSKVAIGSAGYTASGSETALTTQIKQITPEGSSVPAPGIIHITASDSSTDAYSVKEIGLFAGSTLFAIYSQTAAILTKSSGNVALFSIDLALTNVPAGSVTIGAASFQYPPATEAVKGVAEIATTAEVTAGTNDTHIVTPAKLAARIAAIPSSFVRLIGDTMTGFLTLSGNPTSALHATPKQYVDTADALRVAKSGDTMTGLLTLSGAPTTGLHAATKTYVDTSDALKVSKSGDTMTGALAMSGNGVTGSPTTAKAWARWNSSGTNLDSFGVSSVLRTAVGVYRMNLSTPAPDASYAALASNAGGGEITLNVGTTTTYVQVTCGTPGVTGSTADTSISCVIFDN
jgi:hypothetical protein